MRNAAAAVAATWLACGVYALAPWNGEQMRQVHVAAGLVFDGREFLLAAAALYSVLLVAWAFTEGGPEVGKSLRCVRWLGGLLRAQATKQRPALDPAVRLALLTTLLKAFFGPLMVMSLLGFCMAAWRNGEGLLQAGAAGLDLRGLFDRFGYWFAMQAILFVDVAIFTVGYLVETRRLGNEIRSVDPTLLGWAAALACYPPFNSYTAMVLGAQNADLPQFTDTTVHLVLNGLLLALMAAYTAASVALGLKASNLTHRGIVARGPYALVRHPAYTCKNMAWWIAAAPAVMQAFAVGPLTGVLSLASVLGWTMLYVLRAVTEEDHLRRVDGEYAAYAARVRYRFVPGVL
ncbi:MAG: hypothetical protein JNL85_12345 [Rubrivivax sp.]|nr:hypothetical protein [Rubrivivax sp.]